MITSRNKYINTTMTYIGSPPIALALKREEI
jgi:hypothetical protein